MAAIGAALLAALIGIQIPRLVAGGRLTILAGLIAAPAFVAFCYRFRLALPLTLMGLMFVTSDDAILQTGFPDIGLNVVDLIVLAMGAVLGVHYLLKGMDGHPRIHVALFVLLAVGIAELGAGILLGAPTRSALRDFRFFVYVPVITAYMLVWRRRSAIPLALIVAWYCAVSAQWVELWMGVLVLRPGAVLGEIPTSAGASPWHFLSAAAFVPLLVSLAALLGGQTRVLLFLVNLAVVVASTLLLVLSFGRSLWLSVGVVGIGVVIVGSRRVLSARLWLVGAAILLPVVAVIADASMSPGVEGIATRLASFASFADASSLSRFEDNQWTAFEALRNPLGYGLGLEPTVPVAGYLSGVAAHMGYLWLLYRGGFLAMLAFGYVLVRAFRAGLAAETAGPIRLGFFAALAAWSTMTASATFMLSFMAMPFWGLFFGLLLGPTVDGAKKGDKSSYA